MTRRHTADLNRSRSVQSIHVQHRPNCEASDRYRPGGADDATGRVIVLFLPMGNPPWHAADSEQDGEHVGGNPHRSQQQTAVKVHVGI